MYVFSKYILYVRIYKCIIKIQSTHIVWQHYFFVPEEVTDLLPQIWGCTLIFAFNKYDIISEYINKQAHLFISDRQAR